MSENIYTALLVLVVGMLTVFVVLSLVVLAGRILIITVNRFTKDPVLSKPKLRSKKSTSLSPAKVAALAAVVEIVTQGKGKLERIESLK